MKTFIGVTLMVAGLVCFQIAYSGLDGWKFHAAWIGSALVVLAACLVILYVIQ